MSQISGTDDSLRSVKFIDSQTGWIAGTNGVILRTTNSGSNWTKMDAGIGNDLNSVFLISASSLYIAGESGALISTSDNGNTWNYLNSDVVMDLNSVFFINSLTGWAAGDSGVIIRTTNSGISWIRCNSNTDIQLNSVCFSNTQNGWAAGYGAVLNTSDGGNNWSNQFTDGNLILNSVYFSDTVNGWSAYYDNSSFGPEIVRTTDGGSSWINHTMNNSYSLCIFFINSFKGWSAGYYGKIDHSADGGISWQHQTTETIEHLNSIYFTDSLTGWAAGNSGTILKTTTGGIITNLSAVNLQTPSVFYLEQNYPNPFNPVTYLEFGISELGFISLKIHDLSGKDVMTLVNSNLNPGKYKYLFDASGLASGIYFYTLKTNVFSTTRLMLLLK
ncbi:MAG: T9SS type A sorting domain-containing protein [Ignavibacteria bacterium]|nr:T9SS type A sorting domain-containing protein [Ignavibacteria bacterium]